MIDFSHLYVEEERRKDMIREAERRRLVKAVLAAKPKPNRFYHRLLTSLGRSLTEWGLRLQARYGGIVEIPSGYYAPAPPLRPNPSGACRGGG